MKTKIRSLYYVEQQWKKFPRIPSRSVWYPVPTHSNFPNPTTTLRQAEKTMSSLHNIEHYNYRIVKEVTTKEVVKVRKT